MHKALELLKECKELLLDVTIEKNGETAKVGILWLEKFYEAIAELEEDMKPKTCEWKECDDEHNTHWQGTCGAKWTIEHGTPQENHMNFCPQCGGKLVHIYSKNNA